MFNIWDVIIQTKDKGTSNKGHSFDNYTGYSNVISIFSVFRSFKFIHFSTQCINVISSNVRCNFYNSDNLMLLTLPLWIDNCAM